MIIWTMSNSKVQVQVEVEVKVKIQNPKPKCQIKSKIQNPKVKGQIQSPNSKIHPYVSFPDSSGKNPRSPKHKFLRRSLRWERISAGFSSEILPLTCHSEELVPTRRERIPEVQSTKVKSNPKVKVQGVTCFNIWGDYPDSLWKNLVGICALWWWDSSPAKADSEWQVVGDD